MKLIDYKITAHLKGLELDRFLNDCREALQIPEFEITEGQESEVSCVCYGSLEERDEWRGLEELDYFFVGQEKWDCKIEINQ